jgi:hypothetical protein
MLRRLLLRGRPTLLLLLLDRGRSCALQQHQQQVEEDPIAAHVASLLQTPSHHRWFH